MTLHFSPDNLTLGIALAALVISIVVYVKVRGG